MPGIERRRIKKTEASARKEEEKQSRGEQNIKKGEVK
jgi:hypothetical protein